MPTKRVYKRKRRGVKRTGHLTKTQRADVKRVIGSMSELKMVVVGGTHAVGSGAALHLLTAIPGGSADGERVGNQIYLNSLKFKLLLTPGDEYNLLRMIVFQWLEDSVPIVGDVLEIDYTGVQTVLSHYNRDLQHNCRILYDKTFHLVGNASTANMPYTPISTIFRQFSLNMKKVRRKIQYTSAVSSAGTNKIYYLEISDSAATPYPGLETNIELLYRDM